ncbi:MAG: DUF559 domain-containing protein [Nocardioidaceae bacterium]
MAGNSFDLLRPFSTAEALSRGVTRGQLRSAKYRQVMRGYHVATAAAQDPHARIRAAVSLHPAGAFASHLSAARLYGLPVPMTSEEHVTVTRDADKRWRTGVPSHQTSRPVTVTVRHGIAVSAPCDTFVALGSMLDLVELTAVGDAMVRMRLATVADLVAATAASSLKGAPRARKAAGYVRAGVGSPQETRLRMLIVLAGLPEPAVNYILRDDSGEWIARFDLSYPQYRLIIEYDGRQHAENPTQWERDLERHEMLDNDGWKLVTVTAKGIYSEPERTLDRVTAALRARGRRVSAVRSQAWRPYFPSR